MRRKTLLLINGSQVLMDLTKKILEREGYSVRCAVGIAGAREQLMDFTPDGIILDNDLPDGNGLEYCSYLRRNVSIPVMFLSNAKEDELPALQAGANDFLKKPFDYEIMKARIGIMLKAKNGALTIRSGENAEYSANAFEENIRSQKLAQSAATAEPLKKKRIPKVRRIYMTMAAGFAFVIIGFGMFAILNNNSPDIFIPDEQVPVAGLPFQMEENTKLYSGGENYVHFPEADNIAFPANTENVKILLLNPDGNPCYFTFEIVLKDTGESLYSSGMVEPGMYIDEITFSRKLAKGEYNAVVKIRSYALDSFAAMNDAELEFTITAV